MTKVTAIICAYNEVKTVSRVVCDISKNKLITEIIVINDGSKDKTKDVLQNLLSIIDFRFINLKQNEGKGFAMAKGLSYASGDVIMFFDADLENIKQEHLNELITPLLKGECHMVLGQPTNTLIKPEVNPFKAFAGQRAVFKKDILPILSQMSTSKFGVETLINMHYKANSKNVKRVVLDGLLHPTKFQKTGKINASKQFIFEVKEIFVTFFRNSDLVLVILKNKLKSILFTF